MKSPYRNSAVCHKTFGCESAGRVKVFKDRQCAEGALVTYTIAATDLNGGSVAQQYRGGHDSDGWGPAGVAITPDGAHVYVTMSIAGDNLDPAWRKAQPQA
jgi:DNA-binding beta-propeller fold protein YncE